MYAVPDLDAPALEIPLYLSPAACGFPSPAQDYVEQTIDLNQVCIQHPAATFYVRACGYSMVGEGIHDGDLLVIDRAVKASHGAVVLACLDGEFTVKKLQETPIPALLPSNPDFQPIYLQEGQELEIFGVVTFVIHKTKQG
ncbi:translesion error-prone DNA polymerase V autoproteolytic subunit [Aeromonas hydrophila]|uniref:UmuD protein n=1 Tax=Aeromonas hydrophila subsp. hydrophila (strain ATCC 7966 / DSM 30187 / BCRC 13018 / CCUG 14551 / JCM 1027 / KCTC 2358 / NCIMB 9240 / NCTC 8049) TaxID=380703 RepID=A0KJX4_AERHH|nr:translesion error-prone DNA polymerase V autoproteolytic subunit [Aeromonas hydrophila]ABK36799.1 umuD protein [Aeromonas hydrophila subsp. hydrophila ATCC 7966]MBS4671259.1 translesion error-prone DNA polymerase V autoproteolytic subunit [Aeromonas hydrophila]OOD34894.1 UV protection and mutation protein [Aeromonas hydrophila]SUU27086.1 umuD protein [Aeromonas hydrophila]HEG4445789.1 translesion error-prone DNA polymerase V autoproteolytic subunit [Aeromonas hydrophila]